MLTTEQPNTIVAVKRRWWET